MPEAAPAAVRFGSTGDARPIIDGILDEEVAAAFPGWPMLSPAYPTADHVIPFKLFALLAAALPRRWATLQVLQAAAVKTGIAQAFSGTEGEARMEWDRLQELAFPAPAGSLPAVPVLFPVAE
jgi:hypothetical protein